MRFTTTFTDKKKLLIIIEFTYNILAFFLGGGWDVTKNNRQKKKR